MNQNFNNDSKLQKVQKKLPDEEVLRNSVLKNHVFKR